MLSLSLGYSGVGAEQDVPARYTSNTKPITDFSSALAQSLSTTSLGSRAGRAELDALKKFYEGRRYEALWVSGTGYTAAAQLVRGEIERADEWGLEASAFRVPPLPEAERLSLSEQASAEIALSQSILKYAQFARGGRTEPLALSRNLDRKPPLLDPGKVLAGIVASDAPDAYLRSLHPQHPQFDRLRRLYAGASAELDADLDLRSKKRGGKKRAKSSGGSSREKLLVNMEQWRWMPEDLGRLYVWVNIPEYIVRVIKEGREIHSERAIVGATTTPTPILSDEMEHLIFHPRWNVPDSIKVNELLPSLEVGDYKVLSRQNLRVAIGGRDIDARSVDWSRTDIRKYYVYQPPGSNNALGLVKFLFPNKHDVYLHDTPSKSLFNSQVRAISHGCIRVRHPLKLAELLLTEDQGWDGSRIAMTVQKGPQDNQVNLSNIPVHLTYFTAWVDDDGRVRTFSDVYDHEHRIAYALAGKSHRIRREPEPTPVVQMRRTTPSRMISTESRASRNEEGPRGRGFDASGKPDWMKQVFQ
jgi:murein L,D-transpeptidase YcbB/YkuD